MTLAHHTEPKLTKRRRAQVVELLRCAADIGEKGIAAPLTEASWRLFGDCSEREIVAGLADDAIQDNTPFVLDMDEKTMWRVFAADCLEAALRVEEGSWP